ncbi:hypothetical protein Q5752_005071 [Cryptotrichosporon argae]
MAQYAFRAQKTAGLVEAPAFAVSDRVTDAAGSRSYVYAPNGAWFAYALADKVVLVSTSATPKTVTIVQANVLLLSFSPLGTTLFTFERPVKSDSDVYKNVKAWNTEGELVGGWYQKGMDDWEPAITPTETHLLRPTNTDILVFSPPLAPRPSLRLKADGAVRGVFVSHPSTLSFLPKPVKQADEPGVAVWVGERKGAPGYLGLYSLSALASGIKPADTDADAATETRDLPTSAARKAFYKADKLNVKWNNAGTMALFLAHTDVDNTGKSYYGETNLYLVALDGSFDGLVDLDKEGPIYDFCWSPNSREFTVSYGYMPARTQLFDAKAKPLHSFGSNHRNFLAYQPQGRLLLSAGFGNLAGAVDVWEVSTRKKIAEFKAANASTCEWSPCGRYVLTATLSPRLRVDNGVKVWWADGTLLHVHNQDELYQASWKKQAIEQIESYPSVVPKAPEPNESVKLNQKEAPTNGESKPVGAYRPPGARGTLASSAYMRDDDASSVPGSGASTPTPMFKGGKPGARYIPGAAVPGAGPPGAAKGNGADDKKKRTRTKREKKDDQPAALEPAPAAAPEPVEDEADAAAKKVRNLTKKLKAIEDLKSRADKGEVLEKTQLQKIETESAVRAEIRGLGGSA